LREREFLELPERDKDHQLMVTNRGDLCPASNEEINEKFALSQFNRLAIQHYFDSHNVLACVFVLVVPLNPSFRSFTKGGDLRD